LAFLKKKKKKKEVHIGPFFIPCPKHAFETLTLVKSAKLGKLGIGLNEPTNGDLCHYRPTLIHFPLLQPLLLACFYSYKCNYYYIPMKKRMIMTMRKEVIPYHMLFLPIKLIENLEFR
jgi:hypothetical protein